MKILLSYGSEHDKGEGVHYDRVLRRLGHDVVHINAATCPTYGEPGRVVCGYPPDVSILEIVKDHPDADLFLYIEPRALVPRDLEASPIPTACLLSDTHRNPKARRTLAALFDHVFVYHRNHTAAYTGRDPATVHWVPYACDTQMFRDLGVPRDLDVAFVGRLYTPERRRIMCALTGRHTVSEPRNYLQHEIPQLYSRAKIVIDLPPGDYIPFRVFEAMSCGAMLLTRRMPSGIEELFREGEHYEAFDTDDELLDKVGRYLRDDDCRVTVAAQGYAAIQQDHTLERRLTQTLDAINSGVRLSAPVRSMTPWARNLTYARVYERMGRVESLLALSHQAGDVWSESVWRWYACRSFARRTLLRW